MKNVLLVLLAVSILSCEQNKPVHEQALALSPKDSVQRYDSLNWNEIKINGEIPLITDPGTLYKKLGKPDSISAKMDDCGMFFWNRDYKKLYVKGLMFEATEDSVVFRSIDLRDSEVFLSSPKFRLDKNTSIDDLQKFFPNSFSRKMDRELYGLGIVKSMQLYTSETFTDDFWILFFDDKKLIRADYWIGC